MNKTDKQRNAKEFEIFLDVMDRDSSGKGALERALYLLFKAHPSFIAPLMTNEDFSEFHKAFRQFDVTNDGKIDMAIWHLIDASKIVVGAWLEAKAKARGEQEANHV